MNRFKKLVSASNCDEELAKRFWSKVQIRKKKQCWLWQRGTGGSGYGNFRVGKNMVRAHRLAYELIIGEITGGLHVLHNPDKCSENRLCVNPYHMKLGTNQENMNDAKKRGSHTGPRQSLSKDTVKQIRIQRIVNKVGVRELEEIYNVVGGTIFSYINNSSHTDPQYIPLVKDNGHHLFRDEVEIIQYRYERMVKAGRDVKSASKKICEKFGINRETLKQILKHHQTYPYTKPFVHIKTRYRSEGEMRSMTYKQLISLFNANGWAIPSLRGRRNAGKKKKYLIELALQLQSGIKTPYA